MFDDRVTRESYAMILDSFLIPELCFQQDGAGAHTTPDVLEFLHYEFQHRVVSNRFPQQFLCGFSWPTMQSRAKSVCLLPLGVSEGQSVQQWSLKSD